ncbi:WD repeat-containing protein 8 [Irpex rosettiformis]|uniref:WD repeat-containing protein 8 n=1 Tax=Irpex rosettiformis TaxID=378272 RepID=A0ACB8UN54_9APHY|nr:WD repeat-containing protein 8 [Irpex rosettiformis]
MDFTEIYKQTAGLVSFSPGTHFILTAANDRVVIRRADSFQVARTWQVIPPTATTAAPSCRITHAAWSCDSEYVLAACAKQGFLNVFKLRDESWNASIDAGLEGLVKAEWAPDGRSILCFSDMGLRVTVWSLITGMSTRIQFPVHTDKGYAFRNDARYFLLAERHKSKDTLGIYDTTEGYRLVRHFPLPTGSLASLSLSPAGDVLAVWEGALEASYGSSHYKLYIISLSGDVLGSFSPETDRGFGVRNVAWHPSGAYLAVSGWDDKIYVLESVTWGAVATLELQARVPLGVALWREPANWVEKTQGRGFLSYERPQTPTTIAISRPDLSKPYPKSGTVQLAFNTAGSLLLARFESTPNAIHLFAFPSPASHDPAEARVLTPTLRSILVHSQPVANAQWNPARKGSLVACCARGTIYLWSDEWVGEGDSSESEEVAECIGIPAHDFSARDVRWAPDGKGLVLVDKETFCCAFEVEDADHDMEEQDLDYMVTS